MSRKAQTPESKRLDFLFKIRASFTEWCRLNGYEPAAHHKLIISELERTIAAMEHPPVLHEEKIGNKTMLILPTGSAKSTYVSQLFPPWFLSRLPGRTVLACSCVKNLADKFGKDCRNLVDMRHVELGYSLRKDSQACDDWNTDNGGGYFCAGVGGRIAGRRFHLGLIDDPFGSETDADSETLRDQIWRWYLVDFLGRAEPGASIFLITTRYHEDDLAGRLLATERNEWRVIHLPLLVETAEDEKNDALGRKIGDMLWPEYFTRDRMRELQKDARGFNARQQGRPSPSTGAFFTADMIRGYANFQDIPEELTFYCSSDHAVRKKQANDRTCLIPAGMDSKRHIWILPDVWWRKADTLEVVNAMFEMCKRRLPVTWWCGRDNISGSIGPFLRQRMIEDELYINLMEVSEQKVSNDKVQRAQSFHGRCAMGMVHFPTFASWWPQAMDELLKFPNGKNDDFVDALSLLGIGLTQMIPAQKPPERQADFKPFDLRTDVTAAWLRENNTYGVNA